MARRKQGWVQPDLFAPDPVDKPEPIESAPRRYCVHSTIHRMLTGGSIFVTEWVHAECLLPMEPPRSHHGG